MKFGHQMIKVKDTEGFGEGISDFVLDKGVK